MNKASSWTNGLPATFCCSHGAVVRRWLFAVPLHLSDGTFERTFQVNGPVELDVATRSGDVVVHNGPADSVRSSARFTSATRWL